MNSKLAEYVKYVREIHELEQNCNLMILKEYRPLMKFDLTAKQEMLLKLINKNIKLTVSEIAEKMDVTSSAVSQIISKLEKGEYVKREINPDNRREIIVTLNQKGVEYFSEYEKIELKIIKKYYSKLDIEEVLTMRNITLKLEKSITEEIVNEAL